jgi:hypothetical protein
VRIVHEAVENGVGVGGIANNLVPGRERELGGDDRRSAAISLLEDFEQIVTGAGVFSSSRRPAPFPSQSR